MTADDPPTGGRAFEAVLIFDGDCPFCSAAASALRRLDGVGAIPWSSDASQAFLSAQFGEAPFALVFADPAADRVWMGRAAASELCNRAGLPVLVQDVLRDNYEVVADAIRTVTGVDGEPDDYHAVVPMADEARAVFDDLAANATRTHRPSSRERTSERRGSPKRN